MGVEEILYFNNAHLFIAFISENGELLSPFITIQNSFNYLNGFGRIPNAKIMRGLMKRHPVYLEFD